MISRCSTVPSPRMGRKVDGFLLNLHKKIRMQKYFAILIILLCTISVSGQYQFEPVVEVACTPVKDQQKTGTCWSFATSSFMESELIRQGKGVHDLSEMYVVKQIYLDKARNYILRQGNANFSEGSLSHDFISAMARHGVVPETLYSGRSTPEETFNHEEFVSGAKGLLQGFLKQKPLSSRWEETFRAMLEVYFGETPVAVEVNGKNLSPVEYAQSLGIRAEDYISLTSFTHHPYYSSFVLEIPDNFSNGSYYNVTLDELVSVVDEALADGYTVAWDGDVSEKGFSASVGLALLPGSGEEAVMFSHPVLQKEVSAENRQENFERLATTDDHLMHLVGIARDQEGNKYYKVKNSWGEVGQFSGFLYMSEAYFRMKTIAVMVHKDAVPKSLRSNLNF